jgi:hypothetical protein
MIAAAKNHGYGDNNASYIAILKHKGTFFWFNDPPGKGFLEIYNGVAWMRNIPLNLDNRNLLTAQNRFCLAVFGCFTGNFTT